MLWSHEADVLVVGAGPIGLTAALELAQRGVSVEVIDEDASTESRNHGVTLHPATLAMLEQMGLLAGLLPKGLRLDRVVYYDRARPRATVDLGVLDGPHPYLLVLPHLALENALAARLRDAHVRIRWSHRLSQVEHAEGHVVCTVERLGDDSGGYSVSDTMLVVQKVLRKTPKFVLGADGFHSVVRRRLDIGFVPSGEPQGFAPTELRTSFELGAEMRVIVDDELDAVTFPLPGGGCRFMASVPRGEIPPADGHRIPIGTRTHHPQPREAFVRTMNALAPWLVEPHPTITWAARVRFEPGRAERFGAGRVWIVGDAAHVTGPIGVQSLNLGMREARDLAGRLADALAGGDAHLDAFQERRIDEWDRLLGLRGGLSPREGSDPWVAGMAPRLLSTLPATGADLATLASRLGLSFA
jgi:2-polyprenyl-6-methoxyphenol hydroxylase-like FAD-dependent oxidoreductase